MNKATEQLKATGKISNASSKPGKPHARAAGLPKRCNSLAAGRSLFEAGTLNEEAQQAKRDNNLLNFESQDQASAAWHFSNPAEWMRLYYLHGQGWR